MRYGTLLNKLLEKDYENLTIEELGVLDKYRETFGLGDEFKKLYEDLIKGENNLNKIKEELETKLLPRILILENLSKLEINEPELHVNFRGELINNLRKMDNLRICYFIDKVSYQIKENNIRFFGVKRQNEISYHMINNGISDSYILNLVFEIFEKNSKYKFLHLDVNKFNKQYMIEVLNKYFTCYLYILEIISDVVLNCDEDELSKKTLAFAITKEIKQYLNVIREDKKLFKVKGNRLFRNWSYFIEILND